VTRIADTFLQTGAVEALEVSDPTQPRLRGAYTLPGYIRTVSASGNLAYVCGRDSGFAILRYTPMPPFAPGGLRASPTSWKRINVLWWDPSSYEDGFKLERRAGTTAAWSQITTAPANTTGPWPPYQQPSTYQDAAVAVGATYYYRVRAFNTSGNSPYSNLTSATVVDGPPAAPSNLHIVGIEFAARPGLPPPPPIWPFGLAWTDNSINEEGFGIDAKIGPMGAWSPMTSATADATYLELGSLLPTTTYYFRIRAGNPRGVSAWSNETSYTTIQRSPLTPSNLTAMPLSGGSVLLTWRDNSTNEDGFIIRRGVDPGYLTEIVRLPADTTSWTDTSPPLNSICTYVVRAYNSAEYADSNSTSVATLPAVPTNLTADAVSDTQINLSWQDNSPYEAGVEIKRLIAYSGTWVLVATVGPDVTTYQDTPLPPSTTFRYVVRAFNDAGYSSYSNVAVATTWSPPPTAPADLTATAVSYRQINLSWSDNSNSESGFKIERAWQFFGWLSSWSEVATLGPNMTSYQDTGLTTGTIYHYRVRAFSGPGFSPYSNEAIAVTWDNIPIAPANLTITAVTSDSITLTWRNYSHSALAVEVERYNWQYRGGVITTLPASPTTYRNTGLRPLTTYSYRLRAYNSSLQYSAYSDQVSTRTLDVLPAPTNLAAVALPWSRVVLTWRDNSTDDLGFKIDRKRGSEPWAELTRVGPNVTLFINRNVWANLPYSYRVRAYNWNGDSAYSNEVTVRTPIMPLGVRPSWSLYK